MVEVKKCEHWNNWKQCNTCKDWGCSYDGCEKQIRKEKKGIIFSDFVCETCRIEKCSLRGCNAPWKVCDTCNIGGCSGSGCEKKTWTKDGFFNDSKCISKGCKK